MCVECGGDAKAFAMCYCGFLICRDCASSHGISAEDAIEREKEGSIIVEGES
jgi:hypothetical protein